MKQITIDEYKQIVLGILIKIDKVCRENNLTYQLAFGTLLGCIRHKGFIPWDDDIDIIMPRDDYNRLRDIITKNDMGLNFISIENCAKTIYPYGKVCDTTTTMIERNFRKVPGYGAFVDVFPLDYLPENDEEYKRYRRKARNMLLLITHSARTGFEKSSSLRKNIFRMSAFALSRVLSTKQLILSLEKMTKSYPKTKYLGLPCSACGFRIDAEKIYNTQNGVFEGHEFQIPQDTDFFLTLMFGDYMKLPPKEERVNKHQLNCYLLEESERKNEE